MKRVDGRRPDAMRPITIQRHYIKHAEGSVLITTGIPGSFALLLFRIRNPVYARAADSG